MKAGFIRVLWVVYFLCVIPALVTISHRMRFDSGFNSVATVADYVQLLELAQTENVAADDVLVRVRDEAGVTGVALMEDTPEFLAQRGLCTIVEGVGWPGWLTPEERDEIERNRGREPEVAEPPPDDWPLLMGLRHDMNHLIFTDPDVFHRIADEAQSRYPGLVEVHEDIDSGTGGVVSLAGEPKIVLEWGLGFDPELVGHLEEMGFVLYPRLRDYPEYNEATVDSVLNETAEYFPGGFIIFDGDSVIGSRGMIGAVAQKMAELNLYYGWVEFAEQRGGDALADRLATRTARVHSIEDEEMEVITPDRAVARYLRSVRERAVRIVYLKPFLLPVDQSDRIDKSVGMFSDVGESLRSNEYTIGTPSIIAQPINANMVSRIAAILALAIAFTLLLITIGFRIPLWLFIVIAVVIFGVCIGAGWLGLKIAALGIAIVSPTLAISWLAGRYDKLWSDVRSLRISPFWPTLGFYLATIAITLTGAFLIGTILINTKTLLQIDAFSGVKLALYLPILLAILIGVQIIIPQESKSIFGGVVWILNVPIRIWHVLLGIVGLAMLFIMIDRSGNFPIISVADWENNIRGWFETALYARPRTKEMFIGHPALVMGLYFGLSTLYIRRSLMYAGLVVGSIGLTSMTNTFCHIHTPIVLSLYRTFAGMIIGMVIGFILGIIILGIAGKVRKRIAAGKNIRYGEY